MSKYLKIIFFSLLAVTIAASCDTRKTYADRLKEERKGITNYIAKNNIQVERAKPEGEGEWITEEGKEIYFHSSSGLYYHQIKQGDRQVAPTVGYSVYVRYRGTTLSGKIVYDYTPQYQPNPAFFVISSNPNKKQFGIGFQEAVRYMRTGGHCKIIVPFNLGNGNNWTLEGRLVSDAADYIPMVYEIWLENVE